jgi:hypothetical protein
MAVAVDVRHGQAEGLQVGGQVAAQSKTEQDARLQRFYLKVDPPRSRLRARYGTTKALV